MKTEVAYIRGISGNHSASLKRGGKHYRLPRPTAFASGQPVRDEM